MTVAATRTAVPPLANTPVGFAQIAVTTTAKKVVPALGRSVRRPKTTIQNTSADTAVYLTKAAADAATAGWMLGPGSIVETTDPSALWVLTASGTATITVSTGTGFKQVTTVIVTPAA